MKISLIHPSRGRAEKARQTVDYWINNSSKENEIEHILSIDSDDIEKDKYNKLFNKSIICTGDNANVVQATNRATKHSTGEILIYLSDDFKCPENWDAEVVKHFKHVPSPLLIKVDDCLQEFHIAVLTIPIMNRQLYRTLGYFWYPDYASMFVDEDLYWTCVGNGFIKECPELKFPHEHHTLGNCENDETYQRSSLNWNQGKELFAQRKDKGFLLPPPILSILIPTLPDRRDFFDEICASINNQAAKINSSHLVEIVHDDAPRGTKTTGRKRNDTTSRAKGIYTWHIDDDDAILDTAIEDVLKAAESNPDVIVFNGFMTTDGEKRVDFELRLGHPYIATEKDGKEYYLRFPNHIVPMKRELIKDILFEDVTVGEDYVWAKKINDLGLLKTQEIIDKPIYHYRCRTK